MNTAWPTYPLKIMYRPIDTGRAESCHGRLGGGESVMCQHIHVSEVRVRSKDNIRNRETQPSCRIPFRITKFHHRHRGVYPRTASHAVSSERVHWGRRGC